jgi:hypothetical protein
VPGEVGKAMYSFAISPDGKEVYATVNPSQRLNDHYVVKPPRLEVFRTATAWTPSRCAPSRCRARCT